jgi:tetratricopeptide (TPR) repeat protein
MKKPIFSLILLLSISAAIAQEEAQKAFSEGVSLLKSEKFIEAEKKFSEAILKGESRNGLKMSYVYKAFALNGQAKYDSAIACFNRAVELDSLDPATYTDRAKTYSYKNDHEKAIADFEKAIKVATKENQKEPAYYYLGRIKMLQYENEAAIVYFDKLLELAPTDAEGYWLRGTAKSNMMEIDGSIRDFDMAIKYKPDYMEAYANRGVQKINRIPVAEKVGKKIDCLQDPCADLLKAKKLGDKSVDDMIFLYCRKCKEEK